jgi:superfamily I DNA and RNA helicase
MNIGITDLIGRKASISQAERTLKMAVSAAEKGDFRLASSRAITAIIQAASASVGASGSTIKRADFVVKSAREVIQGIVLSKIAMGVETCA